jgi:hypothetical protein
MKDFATLHTNLADIVDIVENAPAQGTNLAAPKPFLLLQYLGHRILVSESSY